MGKERKVVGVLLPFYWYFMLETVVNYKYRFLDFFQKMQVGVRFSMSLCAYCFALSMSYKSMSCMTVSNPLCALVWKKSTQYSPKHQRSAILGMCRIIYSMLVIFRTFMIASKVIIHMHKWKNALFWMPKLCIWCRFYTKFTFKSFSRHFYLEWL